MTTSSDGTSPSGEPAARTGAAAPSATGSRAGRNLPAAVGVGLLLGALVILSLFWRKELFVVLATASVCIGVAEIVASLKHAGIHVPLLPVLAGTVAIIVSAFVAGAEAMVVLFALACVLVVLWRGSEASAGAADDVTGGFFVLCYPALLAGFSSVLLAPADGAWRVFTFLAVTVASDVGGYAVGVLAGRHPLAPTISPKKSWEGFVGSVTFCMVAGVACVVFGLRGMWWAGLVLGLAVAVAATLGDLAESTIKRDLGIKDMGRILPGHGGLMDRIDSAVLTAPVTWAVLALLVPVAS